MPGKPLVTMLSCSAAAAIEREEDAHSFLFTLSLCGGGGLREQPGANCSLCEWVHSVRATMRAAMTVRATRQLLR